MAFMSMSVRELFLIAAIALLVIDAKNFIEFYKVMREVRMPSRRAHRDKV